MRIIRSAAAIAGAVACLCAAAAGAASHRDERVYRAAEAHRADALALLEQIVNVDSGTGDVAGGEKVAGILAQRMRALGAEVHTAAAEIPGLPPSLIGMWHGSGKARILVIAHLDTVFGPGTAAKRPFSIEGNRAHGPGVGDEKAGVVNAIMALAVLHDLKFAGYSTLTVLIDDSEERGSPGSTALINTLARQNQVELNMEPGDPPDALTVWRKGSNNIRIEVSGRAAHAGMAPQDGRNAAVELIHQLGQVEREFPHSGDGITVNLTILKAGERTNIIPDQAEAVLNVRFRRPEEFDTVLARIEAGAKDVAVPDTHVTVTHESAYPPLTENGDIDALAQRAQRIYRELGKGLIMSGNGGASESALAMRAGIPALDGLGLVGGDFHTDHEWVDLDSLVPRLYLMSRLLIDLSATPPPPAAIR
jgi:glutamate carboxypeptidase